MASRTEALLPRQSQESAEDRLLGLLSNPFGSQIQQDGIVIAVLTSLAVTSAIVLAFCLLRPFNTIVYAPRLRHADEKHKPPPIGKGLLAWVPVVFKIKEAEYVDKIGMDATIFLRVARMCRNMFAIMAVAGCAVIIPIAYTKSTTVLNSFHNGGASAIVKMTPANVFGDVWWAYIALAYFFNVVVCGFLWWNYRAVHRLRRKYLESPEYLNNLHSRTLMVTQIPRPLRSDHGLVEIVDSLRQTPEVPRASIGRNVKDLPSLIEEHEEAVIELEEVLAKYLKKPNALPAQRPLCKPSKKDPEFVGKNQKVDAIDYLTNRIERLEAEIKEVRESVDKRDAMPYGFCSYETVESAHSVGFAARNKHPKSTTVELAPRPTDLIWKNLPLDAKTKRWRRFINNLWITLLTVLYFIPNALIAIFLSKLDNLANFWPAFKTEMSKNPKFWALVQGVLAPALSSLFYFFLPIIFRRLSMKAGDITKTSRERHVIRQLYAFFVFNNLFVFSLFAAVFGLVSVIVQDAKQGNMSFKQILDQITPFQKVMTSLCSVSSYWVTWLVQRNLGAAVDLSQIVNLGWGSFSRKFLNPTPRELIKRTAPPPFDYASYYNYFLFYSTVAICFATLQPIVLVVVAAYFTIDVAMKKYLLLYVFCTKNESGGQFWRTVYNRFLIGTFLSDCIVALMVAANGTAGTTIPWTMLGSMIPLPILLLGFKLYCKNTFDDSMKYYTKGDISRGSEAPIAISKESRRRDRVAVRFGHPALYQKLTVPMVNEKSKHLLAELYKGRLDGDVGATHGFSDVYSMKRMSKENPGKAAGSSGPFEFVSESNMDFENFKNRAEFVEEHGGGGSLYGDNRPGTPSTFFGGEARGRSTSRDSERTFAGDDGAGVTYPTGYQLTPTNLREYSPSPDRGLGLRTMDSNTGNPYHMQDESTLLHSAAPMGSQTPHQQYTPYSPEHEGNADYFRPLR